MKQVLKQWKALAPSQRELYKEQSLADRSLYDQRKREFDSERAKDSSNVELGVIEKIKERRA